MSNVTILTSFLHWQVTLIATCGNAKVESNTTVTTSYGVPADITTANVSSGESCTVALPALSRFIKNITVSVNGGCGVLCRTHWNNYSFYGMTKPHKPSHVLEHRTSCIFWQTERWRMIVKLHNEISEIWHMFEKITHS